MYEVGWLLRDKTIISTSVIKGEDLIHRRPPVSRNTLKIFIRDATSQNAPWVIHENLAKRYGIPIEPLNDMMVSWLCAPFICPLFPWVCYNTNTCFLCLVWWRFAKEREEKTWGWTYGRSQKKDEERWFIWTWHLCCNCSVSSLLAMAFFQDTYRFFFGMICRWGTHKCSN